MFSLCPLSFTWTGGRPHAVLPWRGGRGVGRMGFSWYTNTVADPPKAT